MSGTHVTIRLTEREAVTLRGCISGELENDDAYHGPYMTILRRVARKMDAALQARRVRHG